MTKHFPQPFYHWHFELSSKCTLKCPRCPRTEYPSNPNLNKELSLEVMKDILNEERLSQAKRIMFCGDIGDPIYAKDFLSIYKYIKEANPKINLYTITNGSYKEPEWWREYASICNEYDTINFSVDGYDNETNNMYRVNSKFDTIMEGMKIMGKESKAYVNWALILFKFNQDHLQLIEQMARDNGCDGLQLTRSTKFGSKYDAYNMSNDPTGIPVDPLEPDEEYVSDGERYIRNFIPLTERRIDNAGYLTTNAKLFYDVKNKYNKYITPLCLIGNRGMFINAVGNLYPCSWVSFPYDEIGTERKTIKYEDSFFMKYADRINILKRPFDEVINDSVWDYLFKSFDDPNKAWVECEKKCHKSLVNYNYAVGYETN